MYVCKLVQTCGSISKEEYHILRFGVSRNCSVTPCDNRTVQRMKGKNKIHLDCFVRRRMIITKSKNT